MPLSQPNATTPPSIKVKFVAKGRMQGITQVWRRQLPAEAPVWGNCIFSFDPNDPDYDWLVAYDDLSKETHSSLGKGVEQLQCPAENTILVTSEPTCVKVYGSDFTKQFGTVLTSQEPWAMKAANAKFGQAGLHWFYGRSFNGEMRPLEEIVNASPEKTDVLSTVCSTKQQTHTLHNKRYRFTEELIKLIPEIKAFGHGRKLVEDKAEALDPFKYHIAIENHVCQHHWTEKLSDSFLGYCLPFYYGAPNIEDYFPEDSFIYIDIDKPEESAEIIRHAIENNEYEKRLPAILEARRRVIEDYNFFALVSKEIESHDLANTAAGELNTPLYSRHTLRKKFPMSALRLTLERIEGRWKNRKLNRP